MLIADIRRWLFNIAVPWWLQHGVDQRDGGYVESFDEHCRPFEEFKRTRVTARQIYVFSHAALLGCPGAAEAADHGWRFLSKHAWLGTQRGWATRLSKRGEVLDATPDLYEHAFVLFALAWRHRATGDDAALAQARRTLDFLDAAMRHPLGGYRNALPSALPRQQNPHMHLFEAALALVETAPTDARFRGLADELADLTCTKLIQVRSGLLPELYSDNMTPLPDCSGRIVLEPGHQFEWCWILAQHQRLTGRNHTTAITRLIEFTEKRGVDPVTGLTYNQVDIDGVIVDAGSRTWPNTERMKAAVASHDVLGRDPWPMLVTSGNLLLERYLNGSGRWIDLLDENGAPVSKVTPASTFYHIFLAFAETLRIDGGQLAAL